MLLTLTVFAPLAGALLVAAIPRARASGGPGEPATAAPLDRAVRWVALLASLVTLGLAVALAARFRTGEAGFQLGQHANWVRSFGVQYKVGVDGVSLPLVMLTTVLVPLAIAGSWRMTDRPRNYLALLLVLETAMLGVFAALDMFLFYIFWEAVLIPAYFLIGSWGGERRVYAAVKFFIYTLFGGLLMLVGIVSLYYLKSRAAGPGTFDYEALRDLSKDPTTQRWLFGAFFAAFAVKTPLVPFHTWLPDAYAEAPTTTTVLLAGVMSKLGIYGFLRFALPLFPDAARYFQPALMTLAVVGILYCAVIAAVQKDFKRLVAYSSVSHLGFIVLGIFAFTVQGLQGGVFYMVAHGIVIGGLFFVTGMLEERRATRRIEDFGGLQQSMPRMAGVMLVITLASLALPGLVGFVGEFLTLLGAFLAHPVYAVLGAIGVILGAVYLLWAYQRMWQGPLTSEANRAIPDLSAREWAILAPLVAAIVVLGLFPRPVLERVEPSVQRVVQQTARPAGQGAALAPSQPSP
ncbi:MAG TPA: NADH-quinone oxidoreductase subunit M [Actinomycetota bacterium]|nr:NADH-quinone oxidoreductase subunit M [Actinomycetota bacterium]